MGKRHKKVTLQGGCAPPPLTPCGWHMGSGLPDHIQAICWRHRQSLIGQTSLPCGTTMVNDVPNPLGTTRSSMAVVSHNPSGRIRT